jgi:hypothetical protein
VNGKVALKRRHPSPQQLLPSSAILFHSRF